MLNLLFKFSYTVILLGLAFLLQRWRPYHGALRELFENMRTNIVLGILNALISTLVVSALFVTCANLIKNHHFSLAFFLGTPFWLQVIVTILFLDLQSYAWHIANHRIGFLWRFHAVHHSDCYLDATSALRFHLGEILISTAVKAVFIVAFGLPLSAVAIYELIFTAANIFEHADCRLSDRVDALLACLIISPALHRRHHTALLSDQNHNYATIFSFWDRIFGTYLATLASTRVDAGLDAKTAHKTFSLAELLLLPLRLKR